MKIQLPNEIINIILSYMERPHHNAIMKTIIYNYNWYQDHIWSPFPFNYKFSFNRWILIRKQKFAMDMKKLTGGDPIRSRC
jgi:hypothetical protein